MPALRLIFATFLLVGFSSMEGLEPRGPCDHLQSGTPIQVTVELVGPFATDAPLDSLRQQCPDAQPALGHGFESSSAALDLSIGDLTILAVQNFRSGYDYDPADTLEPTVDWTRAPSHWILRGCGALLPRGVSSCGTWSEVVVAYGLDAYANAEFGPVVVRPTQVPGFSLYLDVTDKVVGSIEVHQDLSRIPLTARIIEVLLAPPDPGAS